MDITRMHGACWMVPLKELLHMLAVMGDISMDHMLMG